MSGVTVSRFWGEEEIKVGAKQRNLTSQLPKRRERGPEGKTPVGVEEKGDMEVKQSRPEEYAGIGSKRQGCLSEQRCRRRKVAKGSFREALPGWCDVLSFSKTVRRMRRMLCSQGPLGGFESSSGSGPGLGTWPYFSGHFPIAASMSRLSNFTTCPKFLFF